MRSRAARFCVGCTLLGALLIACERGDTRAAPATRAADETPALDGMTPEEIEASAEAFPPDRAEEMGVIDTTIHVADEP